MNKDIKKILIVLALFSLSDGFFYNFQELWMLENTISISSISTVFSLCSFLAIAILFLCSRLVRKDKLKDFTCGLLLTRFIIILSLFFLHRSGLNSLINFLVMVDFVIEAETYVCIYPLLSLINKDDKLYASRKLIYNMCFYGASFLTIVLLGKTLGKININYNFYLLIASILLFVSYVFLKRVNLDKYNKGKEIKEEKVPKSMFKKIKNDEITFSYLIYNVTGNMAYYLINGMLLIILTEYLSYNCTVAAWIKLISGFVSVILGILVLTKLTFKNDYVNLGIKFLVRIVICLLAFLSQNRIIMLLSLLYTRLFNDSYEHITDAPYINRFKIEEQFSFGNLAEGSKYLGRCIGTLLSGIVLPFGVKYIFFLTFIFTLIQLAFAYRGIYLRKKENK